MLRNRYLCGLEDVLDGLRDLRTNTVTLNQSNSVLALFQQSRSISIVVIIHVVMFSIYGRWVLRGWHRHR
jgi:hypothetical protein